MLVRAAVFWAALFFSGLATAMATPEGFTTHTIKEGDTLASLVPAQYRDITMRANRIDEVSFNELKAGSEVLLPVNAKALEYVPLEKEHENKRGRVIVIDKKAQAFGAYQGGELIYWGPVSTAKPGKTTPNGKFQIGSRERMHYSSIYNGAPMPYAQQVDGDIFLHQYSLPGYAASHGCIRLLMADAKWLFAWTQTGDTVIVR